jgi:hypothetical protein
MNKMLYELSHPDYESDQERDYANPVEVVNEISMPGVVCDVCGETWSCTASRSLVELEPGSPLLAQIKREECVPLARLLSMKSQFEHETGAIIPIGQFPGLRIGRLTVRIKRKISCAFVWPWWPICALVTADIATLLHSAGMTGYILYPVEIVAGKFDGPPLFEIVPTSEMRYTTVPQEDVVPAVCNGCGRWQAPRYVNSVIKLDSSSWDGSDIMTIEHYHTYILASQRFKDLLEEHKFANYVCRPVDVA